MTTTLAYGGVNKKVLVAIAIAVGVLFIAVGIRYAAAVAPSDYGLKEGQTISAAGSDDPDVYIVNDWGYKRLFLNPVIFGFYGHLGGFAKVKSVTPATRDAFPTSGLFRNCETNDQKVYGVETTGEDTGVLHWVNTTGAQAVADDSNFFKKVFCINSKEFNWYAKGTNYTSVSQVPVYSRVAGATPTPTPGAVTVSLASDNPAAAVITGKATGTTYLKLKFSGTGTISSIRVVRGGAGKTTDLANLYVYDGARRLTSSRSLSSADGSATFSSLNVAVSETKVLSIVVDMNTSGATAGDVNYLYLSAASDVVLSSGTVGGSFPLNGSNFTVSGQVGGTVTIDKASSLSNPNVGQTNAELSEFKLTTATEGAKISRIQMIQGGTVKPADITNLRVEVSGVKLADGTMTSDGYAVFDLSSNPYDIIKGDNRIFKVFGNLAGKKDETVKLYFETSSDLLGVGDLYGFGVLVTNNMSTVSNAHSLTLQGGILTISFVGPTATNISTTTTKTHLLDFDMAAAANIEIKKHKIVLCEDSTGDGAYNNSADTTNGWGDILNVGIINRDTGTMLVGPQDGTSFTTSNSTSCPNSATGAEYQFSDTFTMNTGQTLHLAIVGDVKITNSTAGIQITSGDAIKAVLYGYGTTVTTAGDLTVMKYTGTNTAVTKTDIVPSGDVSGNSMTVQGSSLTLALAATPTGNNKFVKGTSNVDAVGLNFTTALGNPITLNTLTLSGYVADSATDSLGYNLGIGTGVDSSLTVGALVSAVRLVDGVTGAVIASAPTSNNLSTTTGTVQFTNLNWAIPGGTTKTILVKTDLSTNPVSGTSDAFSFDVAATSDVVATDANSNTVNLTSGNTAVNGTTSPTTRVSVYGVGVLTPATAADTSPSAALYWGQTAAPFSKFKFSSQNEGFYIERLNLISDSSTNSNNNVDKVHISYTNKAGATVTADSFFNSQGSVSFAFDAGSGNRPYVPKDGTLYVTVTADIKTAASWFRSSGVNFSIDFSGGNADEFRAVGEGSGTVVDGSASTVVTVNSSTTPPINNQYIYRAYPQVAYLDTPATTIAVGQDVFKFKIDAIGLASDGATVYFDGNTGNTSGSMRFAVYASGSNASDFTSSASLGLDLRRVFDGTNSVDQLVASRTLTAAAVTNANCSPTVLPATCTSGFSTNVGLTAASASFRFQDTTSNQSVNIPAGQSNTFVLRLNAASRFNHIANSTTGRAADFIQVIMRGNADNLIYWTDNGGTSRVESSGNVANILKNLPMSGRRINFQ